MNLRCARAPARRSSWWRAWIAFCLVALSLCASTVAAQDAADDSDNTENISFTEELARAQNLVRANVLGLAQEILETRGPPLAPSEEWMLWERQLWSLYRLSGQWEKLHWRARWLPPEFPQEMRNAAKLQEIAALGALQQDTAARAVIRAGLAADASVVHQRALRRALINIYLADGLLADARIAMEYFQRDYGPRENAWLLLRAGVLVRTGDTDAAVNLLAPINRPAARLLRLYARLLGEGLTPKRAVTLAQGLLEEPRGRPPLRDIRAVIVYAHAQTQDFGARIDALEEYLLTHAKHAAQLGVYPKFGVQDLFEVYAALARDQANAAGLLVGDEENWLEHALQIPEDNRAARTAWFAYLAAEVTEPELRRRAIDAYVDELIKAGRSTLVARMFGEDAPLGLLRLGGVAGLRLSAHALQHGDIRLAAEANANLSELPSGITRREWLLQAARIDIFAGRQRSGAVKLNEWIESFERLSEAQTDAVLQPVFDLQSVGRHDLALTLLHHIEARSPGGKYPREMSFWLAESHAGEGRHLRAADLFLHSALQKSGGFDRWGEAARFRAADALMQAGLFEDARGLLEDMLERATAPARRRTFEQKLQQIWLLQSNSRAAENAP